MELGVTAVMLPELSFAEQIALCAELGVRYYQYRPRVIGRDQRGAPYSNWGNHKFDLTPDRFLAEGAALTQQLRDAGLEAWGTVPAVNVEAPDDELRKHLEGAARAEARCVRIAPPPYPAEPFDYAALVDRLVERYGHVIDTLAEPLGIRVIIETHSRSLATAPGLARTLCAPFPPERIGVIFDMANFSREGEINPTLAVSVLGNYIDCVHIGGGRRVTADVDALGCRVVGHQMCALTEGDLYVSPWLEALAATGLEPPLIIEDFTPQMAGADRLRRSARFLHRALDALPAG
ncbi:MAG: sugar phosphate isomerase/epimerase family protein [Planctomycetota bacterium]